MENRFNEWRAPEINDGELTKYNWIVQHKNNLKLGFKTDIGAFTYINAKNGIKISDYVQIGSHCSIYSVSTIDNKEGPVEISKNARIGTHSVVMPNVKIGKNSIIGAFSLVKDNIEDNVVAYGVPAKVVRKLKKEEIENLENEIK